MNRNGQDQESLSSIKWRNKAESNVATLKSRVEDGGGLRVADRRRRRRYSENDRSPNAIRAQTDTSRKREKEGMIGG